MPPPPLGGAISSTPSPAWRGWGALPRKMRPPNAGSTSFTPSGTAWRAFPSHAGTPYRRKAANLGPQVTEAD